MADSIRELILRDVEETLKELGQIKHVARGTLDPLSLPDFPAISIIEASDDLEPLMYPVADRTLSVILRIWIKTSAGRSQKLNAILADVQKKMMEDNTRGGNAIDSLEGSNRNVYLEAAGSEEAGVDVDYTIRYRTALNNPYSVV